MTKTKQEHFLKLYEPIHDRFERFCRARVFGDMDYRDLMNETLLVAFNKFDSLRSESAFLSFLFGISVRIIGNQLQKKKEQRFSRDWIEPTDFGDQTLERADVYFLHQALANLPEEQRECLILFEISGFSIKEIMEIQSSSESAVKQRLKRGRERLTELVTFEAKVDKKEGING
ncbi:MAG: RNA polymerase sigma factor [Bacteroidota bacterium]